MERSSVIRPKEETLYIPPCGAEELGGAMVLTRNGIDCK